MASVNSKPNQRVSVSKKQSRGWFIQNINYWISKAISLNNKTFTEECLNAANGIISDSVFSYVLNPLQLEEDKARKLPGEIRNIDFLTPIKEKNIGEYIQLPYQFHVINQSPDVILEKNNVLQANLVRDIQTLMAEYIQTGQFDEKRLDEIYKQAEERQKNYIDAETIKGKKIVNLVNNINNFDVERIQRFFYWWATEEFYTYRRIVGDNVIEESIHPLEGYPITTTAQFVEDYPGFLIKRRINIHDIKNKYEDVLSPEDFKYLEAIERNQSTGENLTYSRYTDIYALNTFPELNSLTATRQRNDIISVPTDGFINEYFVCFVTDVKRQILHFLDELGIENERVVEDDYELNPEAGDLYIEDKWISEAWWQVRIGEEADGIYTKPVPYEVQRYGADGYVKIPFGGKKGLLRGNFLYPIPKRIIGSLALYQIINLQIERTIAKYKGAVEIIPQGMINGKDDEDTKKKMFYKMADGTIIYDETQIDINVVAQGYRIVGNDVITNYIKTLIDLREVIRQEAWDMANMNSNRYGQATASETVRNNVSNIQLARLGSVLMIQMFNKALERDHNANMEYAKVAFYNGKVGSYSTQEGNLEVIHLGKGEMINWQLGIFVADSVIEDNKLQAYKELAFNAGQNGDTSLAAEAINADSSVALAVKIKEFNEATKQFQKDMENLKAENALKVNAAETAKLDKEHQFKMDEITLKENLITERELALKGMDVESKDKVNADKNATTLAKSSMDNVTKIEQTRMKPKPSNN